MNTCSIQGHRGARGVYPENSLTGFAEALTSGVHAIEFDAAVTKDNQVVLYHDSRLSPLLTRDTSGHWLEGEGPAICNLTLEQVKTYDIGRIKPGTRYHYLHRQQKPCDGERIPTLKELVELVRRTGNKEVEFCIELKISPLHPENTLPPEAFIETVVAEIKRLKIQPRTRLLSFYWLVLAHAQTIAPDIPTGFSTSTLKKFDTVNAGGISPWLNGFDVKRYDSLPKAIRAAGGNAWIPYHRQLSEKAVAQAHDLGLQVFAWTVNQPWQMRRLLRWKVDGIITDYPKRLREICAKLGYDLPESTPVAL